MKIMSWNVNGIRACAKKGFLDFIQTEDPDILGLQETKAHKDQLEPTLCNLPGRHSYWSSALRKGYSGTAIYSKTPVETALYGIEIERFDSEGRFVITEQHGLRIYNIYFPNGASSQERHNFKMDFLKSLYERIQQDLTEKKSVIVMGDYNIAPKEIDVYDPIKLEGESGFLPEERAWMESFLALGMVDTFRHFHPTAEHRYSWWNQIERARIGNRGWRIDLICISQDLLPRLKRADILDEVLGSDHCPVLIELG